MSTNTRLGTRARIPTADDVFRGVELGDPAAIKRGSDAVTQHLAAVERIQGDDPDRRLLADEQRRVDAHLKHAEELQDCIDENLAAGPPPPDGRSAKVGFNAGSTPLIRADRPLPRTAEHGFRAISGGVSVEEAGQWFRNFLTDNRREERALGESVGVAGGFTVPEPVAATVLDLARAASQVIKAGAQVTPMTSKTLSIPRLETDPTPQWRGENTQIPESDPTFGEVTFDAKSLAIIIRVSRELLEDSTSIDAALTNALVQAFAQEFDRVALYGAGTTVEPRGLRNVAGLDVITPATNGTPAEWRWLHRAVRQVRMRNYSPTGIILHERSEADMTQVITANGDYVVPTPYIANVPRYTTTKIPTNLTVGTGTGASELFVGDFTKLHLGIRTSFGITPLRERYADFGQVAFVGWLRGDVAVERIGAFSVVNGLTAAA